MFIKHCFSKNLIIFYLNLVLKYSFLEELPFIFIKIMNHLTKSEVTCIFKCNILTLFLYLKIILIGCRDPPFRKFNNKFTETERWK